MSAPEFSAIDRQWLRRQAVGLLIVAIALLATFETSGLDLRLQRAFFDPALNGFPLKEHWFLSVFMHHGLKTASYVFGFFGIAVCLLCLRGKLDWVPPRHARLALIGTLLIPILTTLLKNLTNRHCPWDIIDFGGYAPYVSLFAITPGELTRGVCFPAGHASAGFVWLVWAVALRAIQPRLARYWLIGAALAGLLMGFGRMLQGAHFLSHVLWSGWFAWALSLTLAMLLRVPVVPAREGQDVSAPTGRQIPS